MLVTTPNAIKSLLLCYVENFSVLRGSAESSQLSSHSKYQRFLRDHQRLSEALGLFVDHGTLLCDEIDLLLHPLRSELNYPIGAKFDIDFTPFRWDYCIFVCKGVLCASKCALLKNSGKDTEALEETIFKLIPLAKDSTKILGIIHALVDAIAKGYATNALLRVPHFVLMNKHFYKTALLPHLVLLTISWLEQQHFDISILGGVDLADALVDKTLLVATEIVANMDQETQHAERKRDFKLLNLCHDWLTSLFPHVFGKIDRVTFGIMSRADKEKAMQVDAFMPRTRWKLAIPFVSKDVPSQASEFAHPDVIIGLSYLAYRYEGLRFEDFQELMMDLVDRLGQEVGPVKDRQASKIYAQWMASVGVKVRSIVRNTANDTATAAAAGSDGSDTESEAASASTAGGNTRRNSLASAEVLPQIGRTLSGASDAHSDADSGDDNADQIQAKTDAAAAGAAITEVVALHLLKIADDNQMQALYKLLRFAAPVIDFYIQEHVFPTFLKYQSVKISASGQEIGGDMLFKTRVGFSGTPSSLLPWEMGKTKYEKGSDGLMMNVMTNASTVSAELADDEWSVKSLLSKIATQPKAQRYSALIDTGALITGMTNYQVAMFLLETGLDWAKGVVYLDDDDSKVVLVRATMRVVDLDSCGIVATELFAVYDQIHTTGTDLPHLSTFNARAVQTLGKDMVWRDYVQGAWRMRRLQRGHRIRLLVIPEVLDLMQRELVEADCQELLPDTAIAGSTLAPKVLKAICAWLIINSMRAEHVQYQQLLIQNISNVWRKNAFNVLYNARSVLKHHLKAPEKQASTTSAASEAVVRNVASSAALDDIIKRETLPVVAFFHASVDKAYTAVEVNASVDFQRNSFIFSGVGTFVQVDVTKAPKYCQEHNLGKPPFVHVFHGGKKLTDVADMSKMKLFDALNQSLHDTTMQSTDGTIRDAIPPLLRAINCFHEDIDFSIDNHIAPEQSILDVLSVLSDANSTFIVTAEDEAVVADIKKSCESSNKENAVSAAQRAYQTEMVQEQEKRVEQELEQEQEQEVEIEKQVSVAFSRENEEPTPWPFEPVVKTRPCASKDRVDSVERPFYQLCTFNLYNTAALDFPKALAVSSNYFNPKWRGERKLKKVVCVLEYLPQETTAPADDDDGDMLDAPHTAKVVMRELSSTIESGTGTMLEQAYDLFCIGSEPGIGLDKRMLGHLLYMSTGKKASPARLATLFSRYKDHDAAMSIDAYQSMLMSEDLKPASDGRYFVALSLAEGETIRRILHTTSNSTTAARMRLRLLPNDFRISDGFDNAFDSFTPVDDITTAAAAAEFHQEQSRQCLRLFDSQLDYKLDGVAVLLRALQSSSLADRQQFFEQVSGVRRSQRKKWSATHLAKLFSLRSEWYAVFGRQYLTTLPHIGNRAFFILTSFFITIW